MSRFSNLRRGSSSFNSTSGESILSGGSNDLEDQDDLREDQEDLEDQENVGRIENPQKLLIRNLPD